MDGADTVLSMRSCLSESTSHPALYFHTGSNVTINDGAIRFDTPSTASYSENCFVYFGGKALNDVVIDTTNRRIRMREHWNVDGDLTIESGELRTDNYDIHLAGDWTNDGTFTAGSGEVIFDGGAVTHEFSGTTTFYDFTCSDPGATLSFAPGAANGTKVTHTFAVTGAAGNPVTFKSSVAGQQAMLGATGTSRTATWVSAKDSDASWSFGKHIDATSNCTDLGNNQMWLFSDTCADDLCTVTTATPDYMGIQRVEFATLNNYSGTTNNTYEDFTYLTTNVTRGNTYTLYVYGWTYDQYFRVWIDWNRDCDFDDEGEEIDLGTIDGVSVYEDITIPAYAIEGDVRMRIRSDFYLSDWPETPCTDLDFGETEDYVLSVQY